MRCYPKHDAAEAFQWSPTGDPTDTYPFAHGVRGEDTRGPYLDVTLEITPSADWPRNFRIYEGDWLVVFSDGRIMVCDTSVFSNLFILGSPSGLQRVADQRLHDRVADFITEEDEDQEDGGQLVLKAACLALLHVRRFRQIQYYQAKLIDDVIGYLWPGSLNDIKVGDGPLAMPERAAALLVAEVERLMRVAAKSQSLTRTDFGQPKATEPNSGGAAPLGNA